MYSIQELSKLFIFLATGINIYILIPLLCLLCTFYTAIGGFKAVVWTDTLQFVFTYISLIVIFVLGIRSTGGFAEIWNTSLKGHRLDLEYVPKFSRKFHIYFGFVVSILTSPKETPSGL